MAILGSIILFGSFLGWAVFDRISLKHRADSGAPPIPVGGPGNDLIAVAVGSSLIWRWLSRFIRRHRRSRVRSLNVCSSAIKRKTAPDIRARKNGEPIVMLTSYHAHTAALVDRYCDVILVGDSLGNVMHGFETTVPVTLDMMILQGRAVMRGSQHALVVVDMPFGSYEASKEQAFHSAARILKETHCGAVKLEGGARMAETVAFLVERGVPVMATSVDAAVDQHAGLVSRPGPRGGQLGADRERCDRDRASRRILGGDRGGGRTAGEEDHRNHRHSTIGIGASAACDGQVLVLEDMLGLSARTPKFVRRYGDLAPMIEAAIEGYATDVRSALSRVRNMSTA